MNKILRFLMTICLFSCSDGLLQELSRPVADPLISKPEVLSFSEEGIIKVVWDDDELADEYVLYRALDSTILNFNEVYRGTASEYIDDLGLIGNIYHYSLSKVRGRREFDKSDPVLGILSLTKADSYENNDIKENSTLLSSDLTANIFGYQNLSGDRLFDEDWYHVTVPPRRTAYLVLVQLNPAPSGGTDTHFDFYLEGHPSVPVINNAEMTIRNDSDRELDFRFKIFPNTGKFFPGIGAGGTIVSYRISLIRIQ